MNSDAIYEKQTEIIYTKENPYTRDVEEEQLPLVAYGEQREHRGLGVEEYHIKDASTGERNTVYTLVTLPSEGEPREIKVLRGEVQYDEGDVIKIPRSDGSIQDAEVIGYKVKDGQVYTQVEFPVGDKIGRKSVPTQVLRELNRVESSGVSEPDLEKSTETDQEMYERFMLESRAELKELYELHRSAAQGSEEQAVLDNQIKHAKEDVDKWAKKAGYR